LSLSKKPIAFIPKKEEGPSELERRFAEKVKPTENLKRNENGLTEAKTELENVGDRGESKGAIEEAKAKLLRLASTLNTTTSSRRAWSRPRPMRTSLLQSIRSKRPTRIS
jgi:hypothetical protein